MPSRSPTLGCRDTAYRHRRRKALIFSHIHDYVTLRLFQYQGTKKLLNDALYLRTLNEFSSMSIPIQPTQAWPSEAWSQGLMSDVRPPNIPHAQATLTPAPISMTTYITTQPFYRPTSKHQLSLSGPVVIDYSIIVYANIPRASTKGSKITMTSQVSARS